MFEGEEKMVWIYVNTSHQVGHLEHLKVFATPKAADKWFQKNDPEGVVFGYEVLERPTSPASPESTRTA